MVLGSYWSLCKTNVPGRYARSSGIMLFWRTFEGDFIPKIKLRRRRWALLLALRLRGFFFVYSCCRFSSPSFSQTKNSGRYLSSNAPKSFLTLLPALNVCGGKFLYFADVCDASKWVHALMTFLRDCCYAWRGLWLLFASVQSYWRFKTLLTVLVGVKLNSCYAPLKGPCNTFFVFF